ncbi:MAG: glycoside hydrolase family 5 protein [Eubacterium sp.]|nr:glycoside hydrolase family 5 protein [Eubacterium sp.]
MARRYCAWDHVIYEICNEPNGNMSLLSQVRRAGRRISTVQLLLRLKAAI